MTMKTKLADLEVRMLLKCSEKPLSKHSVTQLYRKFEKVRRDEAIAHLTDDGFITAHKMPKPGTRKTPVFYKITDEGQKWVKQYLDNYPN